MPKWGMLFGLLFAVLPVAAAHAEPLAPPREQADRLIQKINGRVAANDADGVLKGLADYRKLGIAMPLQLLFLEGRFAAMAHDYVRSRRALSEYFATSGVRRDNNYAAALVLYTELDKSAAIKVKTTAAKAAAKASEVLQEMGSSCSAAAEQAAAIVAARKPGTSFRECTFAPEMVIVPAGSFLMGSPNHEPHRDVDEGPQHRVNIQAFAVGRFEVTFDQWDACVAGGGCNGYLPIDLWGRGRQPVINVSWDDAQAYVAWLSRVTGKLYRLLTEAEWEYAARAGTTTAYAFGNTLSQAQANFGSSAARPVGSYTANAFGLYDMHGNLWEWTQDCWNESYDGAPSDGTAWTSGDCNVRVIRGATWRMINPHHVRSAYRSTYPSVSPAGGFRVARNLD